ncbi:MAG: hypothetical protein V5783_03570, partial [Pontiella sp.]
RVSRPLGRWRRATPFQSIELGRRRIPISPMVLPDPFLVPGGGPFIQNISFSSKSSPFMTCHIALANLQARAFLALGTPLFIFLRSVFHRGNQGKVDPQSGESDSFPQFEAEPACGDAASRNAKPVAPQLAHLPRHRAY